MQHQGEALRVVLSRHRINLTELAQKMKISRPTIYNWFDMVIVPYENLEKMSDSCGIDIFEEIRKETNGKEVKFYKALDPPQRTEKEREIFYDQKMQVCVFLNGLEEELEATIEKLRAMNKALASVHS